MTDANPWPLEPTPPAAEPPEPPGPDAVAILMNYIPLAHLGSGAALALSLPWGSTAQQVACALAWLYLLPPLVVRATLALAGRPQGRITLEMRAYRIWWWVTQWQMVFNRLPWLEELLRLVPGLYATWIGLWGGRLSPLAFVAPGVAITDRHAVQVERFAVLGMYSRLAGHLVQRDAAGQWLIWAGTPTVEGHALVGGEAGLAPGARVTRGQMLPFGRHLAPFATWPRERSPAADAASTPGKSA